MTKCRSKAIKDAKYCNILFKSMNRLKSVLNSETTNYYIDIHILNTDHTFKFNSRTLKVSQTVVDPCFGSFPCFSFQTWLCQVFALNFHCNDKKILDVRFTPCKYVNDANDDVVCSTPITVQFFLEKFLEFTVKKRRREDDTIKSVKRRRNDILDGLHT
jgi:hypothetical protein